MGRSEPVQVVIDIVLGIDSPRRDQMLGKMLIHGLVAAVLVGSAAAVFAQAKDNGSVSANTAQTNVTRSAPLPAEAKASQSDNGYIRPSKNDLGKREHERERGHDRKSGRHGEDRDDD
ncbi:hypothetical protein [Magnetospirillum sulfuroxidans]|uniref:Uncharacterized protein n=1 Tax=Magnetospirillum sulfuroxidans TaxID=611300 RepID=A0ABS5IEP5_9PROT|nr:hypothetical protein [Magnetospirillum sulfuroxidans]MBR9972814.1 hypothetical protein [Magnetospirillum sulfuroxidans]